jgi:hypothetical protein
VFTLFRLMLELGFCVLLVVAGSECVAASTRSSELLNRCVQMHMLWARYETAHCPNQTGQRAQAEWALYRCQLGDFNRGVGELERLLRRDLISIPGEPHSSLPVARTH